MVRILKKITSLWSTAANNSTTRTLRRGFHTVLILQFDSQIYRKGMFDLGASCLSLMIYTGLSALTKIFASWQKIMGHLYFFARGSQFLKKLSIFRVLLPRTNQDKKDTDDPGNDYERYLIRDQLSQHLVQQIHVSLSNLPKI